MHRSLFFILLLWCHTLTINLLQFTNLQPDTAQTTISVATSHCPSGMVEIEDDYCLYLEQQCLDWRDSTHMVCLRYQPAHAICSGSIKHLHFCVDEYEIPNVKGAKPRLGMSYYDVENFCKSQGKRIGTDQEWTLAAEGKEHSPYPHSWERTAGWCNWDVSTPNANEQALFGVGPQRDLELQRLDHSAPSGSFPNCYTEWNGHRIYDMQGNADEWTHNTTLNEHPYVGLLKGGYWRLGLVRNRARPYTEGHGPSFNGYEVGGRCFKDVSP